MGKYRFENLSEDTLRKLVASLEQSDIPIFLFDQNEIIFSNAAWEAQSTRISNKIDKGTEIKDVLREEVSLIYPDLEGDELKSASAFFLDKVFRGGKFDFDGPDGKFYRAHYTSKDESQVLGIAMDITEIKERRAEARRAKNSLQATLEGLHHGVLLYDDTGHVKYFNESFRATAKSIGVNVEKDMFHREVRDQLPQSVLELLREGNRAELEDFEFIRQAPNGKHYLFESRRLSNNTVLVSTVDVTELQEKRAEAKIIRETLEQTLEGLAHGVMLIDETGHVSYCNESIRNFAKETGAKVENGIHFSEIRANVPHKDPEGKTTSNGDYEYEIDGVNGKTFMVRRRMLDGIGLLVSTVDVSELTRKKAQIRHVKDMFENSLEGLPHGVLLYNRKGAVEYFNSEFEASIVPLGLKIEKGMSFQEVSAQIPENFKKDLRGKNPGESFELVQKGFNDRSYLIEGRSIAGVGFLVSTVDVTELQDAIEAAKAADVAKSSFLANMSHEIRTPMNGVLGMAQVLEQTAVDGHQQKCIDIIKNSSEMLLRIINDILDISKLDAEKIEIEREPVNIEACVNRAIDIIRPKLSKNPNVEIISDMSALPEHSYMGDAGRIRQVLINLLSNGVKFTEKGHVKITTRLKPVNEDRDEIEFLVEDTGVGIDPEKFEKIFQRFEQSDNSTTRKYGGTGLGLSISRRLARLMNGDIILCADHANGACFQFSLTLDKAPKNSTTEVQTIRSFNNLPVLIIDDNPVNHMVLSNQLRPLRIKPYCVTSAAQGLSILRRMAVKNMKIPLVICDYQMPGQTGLDFVRELKADLSISDTPVIILSSADVMTRKKEFVSLGVDVVMEKPCMTSEIVGAVSEQLFRSLKQQKNNIVAVQQKVEPAPVERQTRRILVADDDPVNQEVFKGLLKLSGLEAHIVDNGLQALQRFTENDYDLVLMDISMPVLGGTGATEKIRRFEKTQNRKPTPIIAVTAHALKGDREKFLSHGMSDYLPKPILKADFDKTLKKWLTKNDAATAIAS